MLAFAPLLALAALVAAQADPSINTPAAVVLCQPAQISYTATRTPVFISIIPGGQPSATPLEDLGQQNSSPFTWTANIAAGTSITFQIRDSSGAVAYSAPISIQGSSDSSCLGAGASASASGSASASSAVSSSSAASASSAASTASFSSSASAVASASSAVASISSAASSVVASLTSSRATSSAASSTRPAASSVASASASASAAANAARSNAQVGFAGLLGLAAAVVMA